MKKLIITLSAFALLTACNAPTNQSKTECAVFEGYPLNHAKEFETEPVFIPVSLIHIYAKGDTVAVDSNNVAQGMPIHAKDNRWIEPTYTRLVIHERIEPNKLIKE
jgi:hypothetical protein